ncbi:MAG: hypothetical protein IJ563_13505 [Selenomonadaceae bacterium]|nr:hypothetical protein [Selenomonadaceae bacterium]MBR1858892.1 hypothetical protein [Selenomonadaceae bacterium]
MAVSGIGGSIPVATFRQTNVQLHQIGSDVTSEKMEDAMYSVSNFGNETKLGSSEFRQINEQIENDAVDRISVIMEQDDDFQPAVNGDSSGFSPIGFQQSNDTSFDPAMRRAASSYSYFNQ